MGSYLFFQSTGLFFPRLANQNPLTRLPYATRLHVFLNEAHKGTSIEKLDERSRAERISFHEKLLLFSA
jgi:hypothetical protein